MALNSTIILITGANSGVGYATAKVLSQASANYHIILASRTIAKAQSAQTSLSASPDTKGTLSIVELDVTDQNSVDEAAKHIAAEFGRIDVLMNNAASGSMDPDVKTRFDLCMSTNVTGPAMVAEAFRPLLFESQNPYSIFVGSGAGTLVRNAAQKDARKHPHIVNGDAYIVSKAALNMLAVLEMKEHGEKIKVFVLSPGFVRSNLRGTSEEARSGWGGAGDPETAGKLALDVVEGKRDGDVGCLVHGNGVYPW